MTSLVRSTRSCEGWSTPDYETELSRLLPAGAAESRRGADTFFGIDQPSVQAWKFSAADAARVRQPVLLVIGERSATINSIREQVQRSLLDWLPRAEPLIVTGATHLLSLQKPTEIAEALATFYRPMVAALVGRGRWLDSIEKLEDDDLHEGQ